MTTNRVLGLALAAVLALCGCASLKKLGPKPATQTLDKPGLSKVTQVIIVPGETAFPSEQKRLLDGFVSKKETPAADLLAALRPRLPKAEPAPRSCS